jgi:hypothetical protein
MYTVTVQVNSALHEQIKIVGEFFIIKINFASDFGAT